MCHAVICMQGYFFVSYVCSDLHAVIYALILHVCCCAYMFGWRVMLLNFFFSEPRTTFLVLFREQVLFAPLPDDIACPVRNLLVFRSARASSEGSAAFFSDSSGIPVSASRFNVMLRKALLGLGISDTKFYSAKSFRVGAASLSFSLNMSVEDIQALGRWASTAFLYYIRAGARAVRACGVQKRFSRVV